MISYRFNLNKGWLCLATLIFGTTLNLVAQEKAIKVYPTIGITWRSTATGLLNLSGVWDYDPKVPYDYERNVQGFSINPGIQMELSSLPIGIEYYPNLRYDVVSFNFFPVDTYNKQFLIDHNFNLYVKRKVTGGVGFSIVNSGAGFDYVNPTPEYFEIEFRTYNVFIVLPIKKIVNLEVKALYIPVDFPANPHGEHIMFSLRLYYKFQFLDRAKNN